MNECNKQTPLLTFPSLTLNRCDGICIIHEYCWPMASQLFVSLAVYNCSRPDLELKPTKLFGANDGQYHNELNLSSMSIRYFSLRTIDILNLCI